MSTLLPRSVVRAAAVLPLLLAAPALAHDEAPAANPTDYRWAVYTACSAVFVLLAGYLVTTHRKAAAAADELASIERRLDELEGRPAGDA